MIRSAFLVAAILLLPSAAAAQGRDAPWQPLRNTAPPRLDATKPPAKSCAEFGAGFVRLEGSDTCIRIGGQVGFGTTATRSAR